MPFACDECENDKSDQDHTNCQGYKSKCSDKTHILLGILLHHNVFLKFSRIYQLLILSGSFMLEMLKWHMAGEDHRIHWKGLWPEVGIEEVDGKDKPYGKKGLIAVYDL